MNKKEIEELIKFVAKSGVSAVFIEQKDFKITIKNPSSEHQVVHVNSPAPAVHHAHVAPVAHAAPAPAAPKAEAPKDEPKSEEGNYHTVKSPMIGTFYRTPSPDKPNFVNVGDDIKEGQVICIIEAMKLFNEIESDMKGRIVKVLVEHNTPVEYDTPLFLVEPA